MEENLVIVESPAKAKTIEKFLGKDFLVKSSFGHIRDLSKKNYGINIENGYEPQYEVDPEKKKVVSELKKLAKSAKTVWLASDEDREGEAIAWHLAETLDLPKSKTKRIVFHEITKNAILNAIANPRQIDENLVNAQQARRILDRLVGFELSEVLWKKVKSSLSAGRVQSVAVRLIVDREREIIAFKETSSYKITAVFTVTDINGKKAELKAELPQKIQKKEEALAFLKKCVGSDFIVKDIETKPSKKTPPAPFTTSTLQQEAGRKLGFSVSQTMVIAQKLYEEGKITYMRTDSLNLSDEAIDSISKFIEKEYGAKYSNPKQYKTKTKGAQEAHEAIRPTSMQQIVSKNGDEQRLYDLIYKRTLASQMSDAILERTNITISIKKTGDELIASGEIIKFDGFLKVYMESFDDETENPDRVLLPQLKTGQNLNLDSMSATEKFTHHLPRYTESSLVKKLEELGIGRPSTYAPIISTVLKRGYVVKEDRPGKSRNFYNIILKGNNIKEEVKSEMAGSEKAKLFPTDIAMVVNDFLVENFIKILDFNFTATVEKEFDEIASGKIVWQKMIDKFYKSFHANVKETVEKSERNTGERILGTDPESGKTVVVRIGRFGPIVQLGESEEKRQYASLPKDKFIETITLEEAIAILKKTNEGRKLGTHPTTGKPIYAKVGRYGPMIQIGETDDKEKPQYAALLKGQTLEKITLEEALDLFKLPRTIGEYENKKVVVSVGRFGPYISHNAKFVSLKKTDDPMTILLDRAIELINEKRETEEKRIIKEFDENPDLKIIKDRWGKPCIFYKKKYFKITKGVEPENLSYKECLLIVNPNGEEETKPAKKTAGSTKKSSTIKTATKTSSAKKK